MHGQLKIFIEVMRTNHNGEVVIRRTPVTTMYCSREDAYKNLEDWRTHNLKLSGQAFAEFHFTPEFL